MEDLRKLVDELYFFRDRFFEFHTLDEANQKPVLIKKKLHNVLENFDKVGDSFKNSAEYLMLRGKALNVVEDSDDTAEKLLSKAVKLDPNLTDAWNSLGECYWKNGDIRSAQNCFLSSLNHKKDKVSLRNLSMITRSMGGNAEEKCTNIECSFDMAKEAVHMDLNDGLSWLTLGNAFLAKYFINKQNPDLLKQSLSAYSKAEKDPSACNNFDLHFNKGTVHEYLENFKEALDSYSRAKLLDPTFEEAPKREARLVQYLKEISKLVDTKGNIKKKRLKLLVKTIDHRKDTANHPASVEFSVKTLSELSTGTNRETLYVGRVVGSLTIPDPVCSTFLLVDRNESCVAVSLYDASLDWGVKIGDSVVISEPSLKRNAFTYDGDDFDFCGIRVDSPLLLLVNGKAPRCDAVAPTVLTQFMKSE